jgi:hypothetical protein
MHGAVDDLRHQNTGEQNRPAEPWDAPVPWRSDALAGGGSYRASGL